MAHTHSILFVDDDPGVLNSIKFMLQGSSSTWRLDFASSGQEAMDRFWTQAYDVIVADVRMPGISGSELLGRVRRQFPQTVRIALSGYTDQETRFQTIGIAHQFISKPCTHELLHKILHQACSLSNLLKNRDLQALISQLRNLPSLPILYLEISREIQSAQASTESIGRIIAKDPAMSAKILQLVNSAFLGTRQPITNPAQATAMLGITTIRDLVISIHVFSQFNQSVLDRLRLNTMWDHSLGVANYAREIARHEKMNKDIVDRAFISGLLHDIGKLILAENLPLEYYNALSQANRKSSELYCAEEETFSADHSRVGAYLIGLWGLDESVFNCIAYHHQPALCPPQSATITAVIHAANVFDHEINNYPWSKIKPELDNAFLTAANFADSIPAWRKVCQDMRVTWKKN